MLRRNYKFIGNWYQSIKIQSIHYGIVPILGKTLQKRQNIILFWTNKEMWTPKWILFSYSSILCRFSLPMFGGPFPRPGTAGIIFLTVYRCSFSQEMYHLCYCCYNVANSIKTQMTFCTLKLGRGWLAGWANWITARWVTYCKFIWPLGFQSLGQLLASSALLIIIILCYWILMMNIHFERSNGKKQLKYNEPVYVLYT